MFALVGFRKEGSTRVLWASQDKHELFELCKRLNHYAGIRDSSEGLWDRSEIKGKFWIEDLSNWNLYKDGCDFLDCEDIKRQCEENKIRHQKK